MLDFYDELNDEEKENLLKQIEKIDFSILDLINHQNEEKKKGVITPLKGGLSVADIERNREEYTNVGIDGVSDREKLQHFYLQEVRVQD